MKWHIQSSPVLCGSALDYVCVLCLVVHCRSYPYALCCQAFSCFSGAFHPEAVICTAERLDLA